MSILKNISSPNHTQVFYHEVHKVEVGDDFVNALVYVRSYANEEVFANGGPVAWMWSLTVPCFAFSAFPSREYVETLLTLLESSPFFGGAIVAKKDELSKAKSKKWIQIKQHRDAAENGGFTWGGSPFDSTPISQLRIQGAAQLATLAKINNQPFSIDWTLADNSVRTLNAQEMIAVGTAMGQHINACHTRARQLRSLIEAAQTKEEVEAIYWGMIENGLENPDVPVFTRNE